MTAWPKIMTTQFGIFHCIITNKTTDSKQLCNMLTKSCTFFFLIKGEDVQLPRPDITLATTIWQFIDFPTTAKPYCQKQATFMRIVGFPGVVGAIDGTHVHIIAPTVNEETYQ